MGGAVGATNPEQLFAVGYAACFQSALGVVGRRQKVDTSQSKVSTEVTIGPAADGAFGLRVGIHVSIPGVGTETAQQLTEAAHKVCPYSVAPWPAHTSGAADTPPRAARPTRSPAPRRRFAHPARRTAPACGRRHAVALGTAARRASPSPRSCPPRSPSRPRARPGQVGAR